MFLSRDGLDGTVLRRFRLLGLRNGLWRSLTGVEQALYRASIAYAGVMGRIVNGRILELLKGLIGRLKVNAGGVVLSLGRLRARELQEAFSKKGVFTWCPALRAWLEETRFLFFLGSTWKNTASMFRSPLRKCL